VILEYSNGEKWKEFTAGRANRYIIHCDSTNGKLEVTNSFEKNAKDSNLIVISGLHLLAGQSVEERYKKVKELHDFISMFDRTSENAVIHLELASFNDEQLLSQLASGIFPYVDSIGLNEQEAKYLAKFYQFPDMSHLPEVALISTYSAVLLHYSKTYYNTEMEGIKNQSGPGNPLPTFRQLSRVHVHSLSAHVITQRNDFGWGDASAAVAAGSYVATTQACGTEDINSNNVHIPMVTDIQKSTLAPYWNDTRFLFQYHDSNSGLLMTGAPVAICKTPGKTVGLGDAISATALLVQTKGPKPPPKPKAEPTVEKSSSH